MARVLPRGTSLLAEQPSALRIEASARLHLGFLDLDGGLGRRFGSIGLAIDGLSTRVGIAPAAATHVVGVGELGRASALLPTLADAWRLPPLQVTVEETIPAHAGLGSGTQLALALGVGLARLAGRREDAREVARLLGRGRRSGIGIGAFEQGGFLLDGGSAGDGEPPPVTARLPFPEAWRVLLILDESRAGLHGTTENGAFRALPPFPAELAALLCRLVLMRLLPGLALADLAAVGAALGEIQRRVGDHFAPAQGARFTSPAVSEALAWLEAQGIEGVGQSSWGPTGFALLESEARAAALRDEAERRFGRAGLRFLVARGRNRGAEIAVIG
jgi:beta-ribofuranosylaminobenzene 5'-phosphate synthase